MGPQGPSALFNTKRCIRRCLHVHAGLWQCACHQLLSWTPAAAAASQLLAAVPLLPPLKILDTQISSSNRLVHHLECIHTQTLPARCTGCAPQGRTPGSPGRLWLHPGRRGVQGSGGCSCSIRPARGRRRQAPERDCAAGRGLHLPGAGGARAKG